MSHFERLLQDDLNRLVDRVAARAGDGTAAGLKSDLKTRIERSEERLTALRGALLDGYAEWERAMEECEDLWALAGLRRETPEAAAQLRAPVIRQLAGEEDLARQRARGLVGRRRLGLLVARPQIGGQLGEKARAQPMQERARGALELGAVGRAGALGRRPAGPCARVHHELEGRHLDGLLDPLAELGLDALEQPARVAVLVGERALVRPLAHGRSNIRRSPAGSGSGSSPRSPKKRDGSATLSSSSMVS